jgi:hypothetical protein
MAFAQHEDQSPADLRAFVLFTPRRGETQAKPPGLGWRRQLLWVV